LPRAGNHHKYAGSDDLNSVAWTSANSNERARDVATKPPNAFKLYDMSGNVWEWVWDGYGDYTSGTVVNPTGEKSPEYRVARGGSWDRYAAHATLTFRGLFKPGHRAGNLGFRLSRTVP
jgi:sulfatase modifying factor 1